MNETLGLGAEIVKTVTDAATNFASGFGTAVVDTFDTILTNGQGGLSNLAIWGLVFGGVALIVGLSRMFTRKAG